MSNNRYVVGPLILFLVVIVSTLLSSMDHKLAYILASGVVIAVAVTGVRALTRRSAT